MHQHEKAGNARWPRNSNVKENVVCLKVVCGPCGGRSISASPGSVIRVGRKRDLELVLPDLAMSRVHFELRWRDKNWVLIDLESHNGTFLRERRVEAHDVADNDTIRAGDTIFRLSITG